jgi:hypothetical protein
MENVTMKAATIALLVTGSVTAAATGVVIATHQATEQDSVNATAELNQAQSSSAPTPDQDLNPTSSSQDLVSHDSDDVQHASTEDPNPMLSTPLPPKLTPVRTLFDAVIPEVRSRTQVVLLVPDALPDTVLDEPIHLHHTEDPRHYSIILGLTPDCTANVCSVGSIEAELDGAPYPEEFSERVNLAQNIQGHFQPMTCGVSCSPPVIGWSYAGAFYRIYLKLPGSDAEIRAELIAIANSAIEVGSR